MTEGGNVERNLALELVRVTEAAAIAGARWMGRGDGVAADRAAVDAMRWAISGLQIDGTVVIGEGERDEAPMLFIGERVGTPGPGSPTVEIAVDPLEGTALCASGGNGALSVIAAAEEGHFLNAPDTYMDKIAVGPAGRGAIDLRRAAAWNLAALAEAKGVRVPELTAAIQDRPRHAGLIAEVRAAGARIRLFSDGDVAAAIATCKDETGVDILLGTGGAPEGVLAAAALRCVGGELQGRLRFRNDDERRRARSMGITDLERVYLVDQLAAGHVVFAATGVTDGPLLRGVQYRRDGASTHSVVMRSRSGTVRFIESSHDFVRKPALKAPSPT